MAKKNINWRNSEARKILLADVEEGQLPGKVSVEDAWEFYKHLPAFSEVPINQFKKQLNAHRDQVRTRKERLGDEEAALKQFKKLNPPKTHNNKGEVVFDMTPGKMVLRKDIEEGKHLGMTMSDFYNSRKEYTCITKRKFKERVHQETRRKKFIHYLTTKTAEEKKEKKDRRREMAWTKADA